MRISNLTTTKRHIRFTECAVFFVIATEHIIDYVGDGVPDVPQNHLSEYVHIIMIFESQAKPLLSAFIRCFVIKRSDTVFVKMFYNLIQRQHSILGITCIIGAINGYFHR